jgi:acetyltransferase
VLNSLFYPESLAVIGASRSPGKVGHAIITNIKQSSYSGKIYPVNPKHSDILGLKTYGSILEIEQRVDLAIIAIPAQFVPQTLRDCVSRKVRSAVIISAGFKETGREGLLREKEITSIIKNSTMSMLGPNCLGIINTANNLNAKTLFLDT